LTAGAGGERAGAAVGWGRQLRRDRSEKGKAGQRGDGRSAVLFIWSPK